MIVNVTYRHQADVVRGRRRNPESLSYLASLAVSVADATAAECPVAIRFANAMPGQPEGDPARAVELRLFNGRLLVDADFDRETLAAHAADPTVNPGMLGFRHNGGRGGLPPMNCTVEDDPTVRRTAASARDAAEAELHLWAARRVLVDGRLYKEAKEPLLAFRHERLSTESENYGGGDGAAVWSHHEGLLFRLDQVEFAEKWLRDELGKTVESRPFIEIAMPEALRFPAEEWGLMRAANSLLAKTTEAGVTGLPDGFKEAVEAYAAAFETGSADPSLLLPILAAAAQTADRARLRSTVDYLNVGTAVKRCMSAVRFLKADKSHDDEAVFAAGF